MARVRCNPTLPDKLISQILIRVPVKSLIQYQSVSKTWLSMIKNPSFVKSQLRHALTTQNDDQTLKANRVSVLHLDSGRNVAYLKFPCPRRDDMMDLTLVGSANGIVCVSVTSRGFDDLRHTNICLWNPATTQSKFVPSLLNASGNIPYVRVLGFGYDGVDDDYKIVAFVDNYVVYSDNRNAWRNVPAETIHHPDMDDDFYVCIDGFLCGIYGGTYGMMAFDLNREVMNCDINLPVTDGDVDEAHAQHLLDCTIKLPVLNVISDAHDDDGDDDFARIIEFNNSVAVMIGSGRKINMWTLDDDACLGVGGVEASWTPMFSIDTRIRPDQFYGYFSNGNLVLLIINETSNVKMWISCNADKKEAKFAPPLVDMVEHHQDNVIFKYVESLISLAGFRHVN